MLRGGRLLDRANVSYELGIMHYQQRDCLLLRHRSLRAPPFDLVKDLDFDYERDLEVRGIIEEWAKRIGKWNIDRRTRANLAIRCGPQKLRSGFVRIIRDRPRFFSRLLGDLVKKDLPDSKTTGYRGLSAMVRVG